MTEEPRMPTDWSDEIVICNLGDEPALTEEMNDVYTKLQETPSDETPHVVLNMADVTYLNSSNIAQLLRLRKRLVEGDRDMRLASVADSVWSIILLTGLDKVFQFAPDTATAIASLQITEA